MSSTELTPHNAAPEGLEDFDSGDMMTPGLKVDHPEGRLQDTLSGESWEEKEVILTGLVKQRTLWEPEVSETKVGPLCRSLNFTTGVPDQDRFPWKAAGFEIGATALPCEGCQLKEWGSHPKNQTPWCGEQWIFVLMMQTGGAWSPATLTLQRSNLQAARAYVTSFARSQSPLFVCTTKLSCTLNKRGTVKYTTLSFARGTDTPEDMHVDLAETYRRIREWLQTPRGNEEDLAASPAETPVAPNKRGTAAVDDEAEIDF